MSRFLLRSTLSAACVVALSATPALGQTDTTLAPSAVSERAMPTIMAPLAAPVAELVRAPVSPVEPRLAIHPVNADVASFRRREAFGRPAVLMITGGALLLTGLIVEGDASSILIVSGAGIGAYGLYLHLQTPNARLVR